MNFSFIHTADLHLDRAFSDISQIPEKYNNAVLESFNNLITFAIEKNVDFVLIAGDTFDSDNPDFQAKLQFKKQIDKLDKAGIKVFMICGNHDPLNSYKKRTFDYDENSNIKIVGLNTTDEKEKFIIFDKENTPCALIHSLSFRDKEFKENPVTYFQMPTAEEKTLFNIGLLHCDLNGSKDSPYAPCSVSDLKELNYNYWALGHIHIPPEVEDTIRYSGTIQGRNSKECGAYGFRYICVNDGKIFRNDFIEADVIQYLNINVDISQLKDSTEISGLISSEFNNIAQKDKFYFVKITLIGETTFYDELIKNNFNVINSIKEDLDSELGFRLSISDIVNKTTAKVHMEELKADMGIIGEIIKTTGNQEVTEHVMKQLENKYLNEIKNNFNIQDAEFEQIKEEITNTAKQTCISICSKLYNNEKEGL